MHGFSTVFSAYLLFVAALLGLAMGSFCHNWAFRLCRDQSVVRGRSRCPACAHTLTGRDLVPLISFLFLRGKCRYCRTPIPKRYPLAELFFACGYVCLLLRFHPLDEWSSLLRWVLLFPLLFTLSLQDWESWELSDGLILAGAALAVLLVPFSGGVSALLPMLLGGLSIAAPLLLFALIADKLLGVETMGGGDIKLFAMLGLHLGAALSLLTLILACVCGILLALIPRKGEALAAQTGKFHAIPFGPAIALAALIVGLCGEQMMDLYLSLFHLL